MPHTNINITSDSNTFQYIVEYDKSNEFIAVKTDIKYLDFKQDNTTPIDDIVFIEDNEALNYIGCINHWHPIDKTVDYSTEYVPKIGEVGTLRLYFPAHSIDTYLTGCEYALTINMWIRNRRVVLGEHIFNRLDAIACNKVKLFNNQEYYECIEFPILDAMSLMYSDDWKKWRKMICNEQIAKNLVNSEGSAIYISLHPVVKTDEGYMKMQNYVGGQSSMNLTDDPNDFLNLDIQPNIYKSLLNDTPAIECNLKFNKYYDGDIKEYLIETYGNHNYLFQYEMVIGNSEDIYSVVTSEKSEPTTHYTFKKNEIKNFTNGDGWKPGIEIVCSINIFKEEESVIYLLSNKVPLTEDLFRYLVQTQVHCKNDDCEDRKIQNINYVNLKEVDMNLINLNVVNKIENQVVQIDRPVDAKSNIMQPIFYKAVDGINITVHPAVTEVLCINLDQYKAAVTSFILQIEGVHFIEYGRNTSGVLFKVIGSKLPKEITQGTYYILNQDAELVTTGKYTYLY